MYFCNYWKRRDRAILEPVMEFLPELAQVPKGQGAVFDLFQGILFTLKTKLQIFSACHLQGN